MSYFLNDFGYLYIFEKFDTLVLLLFISKIIIVTITFQLKKLNDVEDNYNDKKLLFFAKILSQISICYQIEIIIYHDLIYKLIRLLDKLVHFSHMIFVFINKKIR